MARQTLDQRIARLERNLAILKGQRIHAKAYEVAESLRPQFPQFDGIDTDEFLALVMSPLTETIDSITLRVAASVTLGDLDGVETDLADLIRARKRGYA